jgi:hypothetical protein
MRIVVAARAARRRAGFGQARVLAERAHRPWPVPSGPWVMAHTWRDLLFAHWPLPADALRPYVTAALLIDTYDGSAWLGITPFEVSGLRPRGVTPLPRLSRFPEWLTERYCLYTVDRRGQILRAEIHHPHGRSNPRPPPSKRTPCPHRGSH